MAEVSAGRRVVGQTDGRRLLYSIAGLTEGLFAASFALVSF